jgi:hypothetical protein
MSQKNQKWVRRTLKSPKTVNFPKKVCRMSRSRSVFMSRIIKRPFRRKVQIFMARSARIFQAMMLIIMHRSR